MQTDRHTGKQIDKQRNKQVEKYTYRHIDRAWVSNQKMEIKIQFQRNQDKEKEQNWDEKYKNNSKNGKIRKKRIRKIKNTGIKD